MNDQDLIDRQIDAHVGYLCDRTWPPRTVPNRHWQSAPVNSEVFWRSCEAPKRPARKHGPDPLVLLAWTGCSLVGICTIVGAVTVVHWAVRLVAGVR